MLHPANLCLHWLKHADRGRYPASLNVNQEMGCGRMKRVLMLHQQGRWETKLSAPSICLAHPSIHLGQPAGRPAIHPGAAAVGKKKEAVSSLREATKLVPTGEVHSPHPAIFPLRRTTRLQRTNRGEKGWPLLVSTQPAHGLTLRGCHTLDSQPGSVLVYALNNSVILVSAGKHGRLSPHSSAITFWTQLCLCFTGSQCSSSCWGEQMQNWEFFNKESCCSIFRQTDSWWDRLSLNFN